MIQKIGIYTQFGIAFYYLINPLFPFFFQIIHHIINFIFPSFGFIYGITLSIWNNSAYVVEIISFYLQKEIVITIFKSITSICLIYLALILILSTFSNRNVKMEKIKKFFLKIIEDQVKIIHFYKDYLHHLQKY